MADKTIAILTGGGDVPGLNAVIKSVVYGATAQPGYRLIGSRRGYRPKKSAHAAIRRVTDAMVSGKTYVIDLDLRSYFDTVRHHIVLEKVARRVRDNDSP